MEKKTNNLNRATINIEVFDMGLCLTYKTDCAGRTYLLMKALAHGIKELEKQVPEEVRAEYRAHILEMLNDRD